VPHLRKIERPSLSRVKQKPQEQGGLQTSRALRATTGVACGLRPGIPSRIQCVRWRSGLPGRLVGGSCPSAAPSVLTVHVPKIVSWNIVRRLLVLSVAGGWGAPPPATRRMLPESRRSREGHGRTGRCALRPLLPAVFDRGSLRRRVLSFGSPIRRHFYRGPLRPRNDKVLTCPRAPRSDGQSPILAFKPAMPVALPYFLFSIFYSLKFPAGGIFGAPPPATRRMLPQNPSEWGMPWPDRALFAPTGVACGLCPGIPSRIQCVHG
jgi:hypothetical protein